LPSIVLSCAKILPSGVIIASLKSGKLGLGFPRNSTKKELASSAKYRLFYNSVNTYC